MAYKEADHSDISQPLEIIAVDNSVMVSTVGTMFESQSFLTFDCVQISGQ